METRDKSRGYTLDPECEKQRVEIENIERQIRDDAYTFYIQKSELDAKVKRFEEMNDTLDILERIYEREIKDGPYTNEQKLNFLSDLDDICADTISKYLDCKRLVQKRVLQSRDRLRKTQQEKENAKE